MVEFKSLVIQNAITYDSVKIPLSNQGLVSVIGNNKDTGDSNGSGKTTMWELFRFAHTGSTNIGLRETQLPNGENMLIGYTAKVDGKKVSVMRHRNFESIGNKIQCELSGEPWGYKKKEIALSKEICQELVPIPPSVFDNCVYLSTKNAHTIIDGTPSSRIEFISKLFGLDAYDEVLVRIKHAVKNCKEEIDSIAHFEVTLDDVTRQLKDTASKDEIEIEEVEIRNYLKKKKSLRKELSAELERLIELQSKIKTAQDLHEEIDSFGIIDSKIKKKLVEEVDKLLTDKSSYEQNLKKHKELKSLNVTEVEGNLKDLRKSLDKLKERRSDIRELLPIAEEYLECISKAKGMSSDILKDCKSRLKEATINLSFVRLKSHITDVCGVCNSKVANPAKIRKSAEKEEESVEKQVAELEKILRKAESSSEYMHRAEKIKKKYPEINEDSAKTWSKELNTIKSKIESIESSMETIEANEENSRRYKELKAELKGFKPDPEKYAAIQDMYEQKSSVLSKIEVVLNLKNKLNALLDEIKCKAVLLDKTHRDNEKAILQLRTKLDKLDKNISRATEDLGRVEEALSSVDSLLKKKKLMELNLKPMKKLRNRLFLLENLQVAYGPKGLKVKKLESILKLIGKKLKEYTSILFTEKDLSFKTIGNERQLTILAKRKYKTHETEYDVKTFSGGERARLSLALIFAIDDAMSPLKRCNIKILDEIDRSLDPLGKDILINKLIPRLKGRNQSIFVISHDEGIRDADIYDKELIVTKKLGRTTAEMVSCKTY